MLGIAAGVIVTKAVLIAGLARLFRNSWPRSIRLGLLLSQAGEFGFVLFAMATAAQLITSEAASLFSAVVTLSMAATPFLMRLTEWLERREGRSADGLDGPERSPETSAIVVGYGRFGQTVAQMLMAKGIGVTLIDKKPSMIETAEEFGTKVYYGDGMRIDLLRTAGADTAKVIAFCNDNEGGEMTRDAVAAVLKAFPQAAVMVRAFDRVHLMRARRARPRLRPARTVRKRGRDGQGGAQGERDRQGRGRAGRARIPHARLRPARAAERDWRSPCGSSNVRSRPTGLFPEEEVRDPA